MAGELQDSQRNCKRAKLLKRLLYVLIFSALVYFSPLKEAIFTPQFLKNFLINVLVESEPKKLNPPLIVTPLTERGESICGRYSQGNADIKIFINRKDSPQYELKSDKEGNFYHPIKDNKLKPGDLVWVSQSKNGENSNLSPAYRVLDTSMVSWYLEKEKEAISSLDNTIKILLSWSVLLIGGLIYLTVKQLGQYRLKWLLVLIFFQFILSIYYGFSCSSEIISAVDKGISVTESTFIHEYWWKQIELFQQGIFVSGIFLLWNLPSSQRST